MFSQNAVYNACIFNAVCLFNANFFANTNAFCFHALSWVIDTEFVYLKYYFVLCKILLIGWFS